MFVGNGARIPLRSRDLTILIERQRERITLRGACVKECVEFRYFILELEVIYVDFIFPYTPNY